MSEGIYLNHRRYEQVKTAKIDAVKYQDENQGFEVVELHDGNALILQSNLERIFPVMLFEDANQKITTNDSEHTLKFNVKAL